MDNRFGIKDAFLFLSLALIAGLVILGMVQFDRQWKQVQVLRSQSDTLASDLTSLRGDLADLKGKIDSGVSIGVPTTRAATAAIDGPDPFGPIHDAEKQPGFARGDWFVDNFGTNIGKLTPLLSTDVYASWVQNRVMESLAYRDVDSLELVPLLATKWTTSPDGKTITFDLRKGVVFSDGQPMTAADVVFTFEWIQNEKVDAPRSRAYFEKLESVKADGDYRVVFTFKEFVFNSFESVATTEIMSKRFYSQYTPQQFNENPGLLIGTGPYRLATPDKWRPGDRVELLRNDRYWGVKPAFDRYVYYEVKDDVASETLYRNREIDRFAATPEQYRKLKDDPKIAAGSSQWEYYSPVSGYTFLGWNERRGGKPTIFADKRVRQAMTMLIDRQRLASEVYFGYATPATGPFGYGTPQNDPNIKPWPYDVSRAKALLKEAGFEDRNGDGTLESETGVPLQFALTYGAGNPFTDRIVLYIKDGLAQAGVRMDLDATDWPIMLKKLDSRDFDVATLGWSTGVETDCNQIFSSRQTQDNGDNFISYINPELDQAIDKARATVDVGQRMKAWQAVHRIIHEDQPYTFLLNRESLVFIDKRVQNIRASKLGLNIVNTERTPIPWFVPAEQQLHR